MEDLGITVTSSHPTAPEQGRKPSKKAWLRISTQFASEDAKPTAQWPSLHGQILPLGFLLCSSIKLPFQSRLPSLPEEGSNTCWLKLGMVGCLGGVPMGTALTGGLPMTGEDDRLGSARSETSCSSSRAWGGLCGRAYSNTDTEGTSWETGSEETHVGYLKYTLQLSTRITQT